MILSPTEPTAPSPSPSRFSARVLGGALLVTATVVLTLLVKKLFSILMVLFGAVLFAILLRRLAGKLSRHTRLPYGLALTVVLLSLVGLIWVLTMLLAPTVTEQGKELARQLPQALEQLRQQVGTMPGGPALLREIPDPKELLAQQKGKAGGGFQQVMRFFSSSLGLLANLMIGIVVGIYLAAKPSDYMMGVTRLIPIRHRPRALEVLRTLGFTLWGWLKGTFISMVVIGLLTWLGLTLIGVPLAPLLGLLAGLFEFVPNIGPFLAGAPAVLLAWVEEPQKALYVIGFFVLLQSLEGYVLTPLVQKKIIDLPPVLTITAQVILGLLAGGLGLLMATPLMAVIMVLVKMLYIEDTLGDRSIEVKGEAEAKGRKPV
jgi:predicted PurR-regulated permease PerM